MPSELLRLLAVPSNDKATVSHKTLSPQHIGVLKESKPSRSNIPRPRNETANTLSTAKGLSPLGLSSLKIEPAKSKFAPVQFGLEAIDENMTDSELSRSSVTMVNTRCNGPEKINTSPHTPGYNAVSRSHGRGVPAHVPDVSAVKHTEHVAELVAQGIQPTQKVNIDIDTAAANVVADQRRGFKTAELVNANGCKAPGNVEAQGDELKTSPLDKELPPKPSLRNKDSPERRGVFDASDSAIKAINATYPALAPDRSTRNLALTRRSASTGNVSRTGSPLARKPLRSVNPERGLMSPRTRVGVGPTIRISRDAHEIIMGTGSGKSRAFSARQLAPGSHGLGHTSVPSPIHPPRTSSLPSSPDTPVVGSKTAGPSFVDRLSRPTKASTQRAATSRATIYERGKSESIKKQSGNEVTINTPPLASRARAPLSDAAEVPKSGTTATLKRKGFRSAMSALLPGRRRTEGFQKNLKKTGSTNLSTKAVEHLQDYNPGSAHLNASNKNVTFAKESRNKTTTHGGCYAVSVPASRSFTTFDSTAIDSPSDVISTYDWNRGPIDKAAPNHSAQDREAAAPMTQVHQDTNVNRARSSTARYYDPGRRGEDEDPTPPENRAGPGGHYTEDVEVRDRYNENVPGITAFLDEGLRSAEDSLFLLLDKIDNVPNLAIRASILQVVGSLEAAIAAARIARMANISLHENIAALVTHAAQISASAARATVTAAAVPVAHTS